MKMYSIGIDIGASHIACGLYSKKTKELKYKKYILNEINESIDYNTSTRNFINTIKNLLNTFIKENKIDITDISSIGIGCPGGVDKENAIFFGSEKLRIGEINWKLVLKEYNLNIYVENDCNCAAICESYVNNYDRFIMFSIGTGVGISFIENGKCMDDFVRAIIEINEKDGPDKRYIMSFYNLSEKYNKIKRASYLRSEIFEFVKQGDELALKILKSYIDSFIEGVDRIHQQYNIDKIIIGGGMSEHAEFFLDGIRNGLPDHEIRIAKYKNDSGIIGAALLEKQWSGYERN